MSWRLQCTAPRRVLGVEATCGCVLAAGPCGELTPGDSGVLTLAVRPPRRSGPFHAAVRVWLHPAGGDRPAQVVVRGHVLSRVGVRPEGLDLGPRTAGTSVERHLQVEVTPELARATVRAALEDLAGSVTVQPSAFAGRPGATLRLVTCVPAAPGPLAGRVVVRVAGVAGAVTVPVTGEAVVRR